MLISVGAVLGTKIPKRHEGLTECSSSPPTKMEDSIHYGTLRVVTEPAQSLGQSPQLNWRLPRTPQSPQSLRNLHNLIGGPKNTTKPQSLRNPHNLIGGPKNTTKPQSRLGFQEPKSNKPLTFTSMNLRGKLTPMHQMQWQVLHSQTPPKLQKLMGE